MRKKFSLRNTGNIASFDSDMKEILQDIPRNNSGLITLKSDILVSENDLKDILNDSLFYRLKKQIFNTSPRYQKFLLNMSLLRILSAMIAVFGTLSDYGLDSQLTFSFFISWQAIESKDFPFDSFFLNAGIFLSVILILSHILSTIVLSRKRRFHVSTLKCKVLYVLAFLCYPVFYVMTYAIFETKSFCTLPDNLGDYVDEDILRFQFSKSINEQKIIEHCVENIPQLILLVLYTMSVPLYGKVKPTFGILFFAFKAVLQYFFFSRQIVKFKNIQRKNKIEMLGKILMSLSSFFFVISRIASIIFCITFSSFYPDLPYFCYHTAKNLETHSKVFVDVEELTPVITPAALKAFGSISISAKPFYFCVVTLILSNLVYFLLMNQIFSFCKEKPSLTSQFLSCLVNGYCPVKQPMTFKHEDSRTNWYCKQGVSSLVLLIYGLTTTLLVLIPFLSYGSELFWKGLPVLDELIR